MHHTLGVQGTVRAIAVVSVCGLVMAPCLIKAQSWQSAVGAVARDAPEARIVVIDLASGRMLAARRLNESARTLAAPGSTLKPLVLYGLVSAGRWDPASRVACDRQLVVGGHRLECTHPPGSPFDAREALTWSCNTYFATVARTLRPGELGRLLRPSGLLGATGMAHEEALADFREPDSVASEQLALLGVEGIRVTPLELAAAYRWLALEVNAHGDSEASRVVRAGLEDSASFGMAGQVSLGGVVVLGKTGTADGVVTSQSHGWFAGIAPAQKPKVVIVVYLPAGRGADAARVAGRVLSRAPLERP